MKDEQAQKEYSFNGQRQGEKVKEVVRNHPITLIWPVVEMLLFVVVAVVLYLKFSYEFVGLIAFVLVLIGITKLLRSYYVYKESVFLITSERIINVGQQGFVKRKITETELDKIQDISSETHGLFKMMFKYGDLIIRTAGAVGGSEMIVKNIARPYDIQQKVVNSKQV